MVPLLPSQVSPAWFEKYWYGHQGKVRRPTSSKTLARCAIGILLVLGGGAVLYQFSAGRSASDLNNRTGHIRIM